MKVNDPHSFFFQQTDDEMNEKYLPFQKDFQQNFIMELENFILDHTLLCGTHDMM